MSHLQQSKSQTKSWGLLQRTVLKDFEKLLKQDKLHKIFLLEVRLAAVQ